MGHVAQHRIFSISFASAHPACVAKVERKERTQAEVDEIITWLTGQNQATLANALAKKTRMEDFFAHAPRPNPARSLITGTVCEVYVEDIEDPRGAKSATSTN